MTLATAAAATSKSRQIVIDLPRLHPAQREIKRSMKRFNVVNCGRRFGKDILDRDLAIGVLTERKPVGWFEPTYKSLAENWRNLRALLAPLAQEISVQEHRLKIIGGGVLEMWSLDNPDAGRGRKYAGVIINEAALGADLEYSWQHTIRPTLFDLAGWAVFSSTPRGMNYFYNLYQMAGVDNDWASWRYPTSANPHIPPGEIENARRELPARIFQQEILAEFLSNGAFFQNVIDCAVIQEPERPEDHQGHTIVAGVDWALSGDFTSFSVGCQQCKRIVDWDRFNQLDFTYQRERLYNIASRWNISNILPERNSIGEPNIEILLQHGLPIGTGEDDRPGFNTTATTKPPLIMGLASALEHEGFQVPEDYKDELLTYTVEMSVSGHAAFSAPKGMNDDRVISAALCWYAMSHIPWLMS